MRAPMFFAWGGYTTVGGAYGLRWQGSPNWTGARTGAGAVTLTWGAGEGVDATQSQVFAFGRTATVFVNVAGQTDTTLLLAALNDAHAATEAAVDFLVLAGAF